MNKNRIFFHQISLYLSLSFFSVFPLFLSSFTYWDSFWAYWVHRPPLHAEQTHTGRPNYSSQNSDAGSSSSYPVSHKCSTISQPKPTWRFAILCVFNWYFWSTTCFKEPKNRNKKYVWDRITTDDLVWRQKLTSLNKYRLKFSPKKRRRRVI